LSGMVYISAKHFDWPLLYGACCLVEGQGTGAMIILGQSEVMRHILPPRAGTALAFVKTAIGFGPAAWSAIYAAWFAPRVDLFYAVGASMVVITMAAFLPMIPASPASLAGKAGESAKHIQQNSLSSILCTLDGFVICVSASTILWGTALLWVANLSTFAVAAGYRTSVTSIQSSFFLMSGVMRFGVGTLMDAFPKIPTEAWTALFATCVVTSSCLMYVSDGAFVRVAAALCGGAWGAAATVDPVLCRKVGGTRQATIYSMGKVLGMAWSMLWVRQAGSEAKRFTVPGNVDCIGQQCFRTTWAIVVAITVPAAMITIFWAVRRSRTHKHMD